MLIEGEAAIAVSVPPAVERSVVDQVCDPPVVGAVAGPYVIVKVPFAASVTPVTVTVCPA